MANGCPTANRAPRTPTDVQNARETSSYFPSGGNGKLGRKIRMIWQSGPLQMSKRARKTSHYGTGLPTFRELRSQEQPLRADPACRTDCQPWHVAPYLRSYPRRAPQTHQEPSAGNSAHFQQGYRFRGVSGMGHAPTVPKGSSTIEWRFPNAKMSFRQESPNDIRRTQLPVFEVVD